MSAPIPTRCPICARMPMSFEVICTNCGHDKREAFDIGRAVQDANKLLGCQLCRGVRFKTCAACGQAPNSFPDHRVGARKIHDVGSTITYGTLTDWRRDGERERPQDVPDRPLQPR